MKYNKIKKKIILTNFLTLNKMKIKYQLTRILNAADHIIRLTATHLNKIKINFTYIMVNNDIRLLSRETSLLLSFIIKLKTITKANKCNSINKIKNYYFADNNLKFARQVKYLKLLQKLKIYTNITTPNYDVNTKLKMLIRQ